VTTPKRALALLVAAIAAGMIAAAAYAVSTGLPNDDLKVLSGAEIVCMAVLVLPWFTVYASRAAGRFGAGDVAGGAWRALAAASVLLVLGQLAAYLPSAIDLGELKSAIVVAGQLLPAAFRVVLCWALWRVRRAYRGTGLHFHLKPVDYAAAVAVAAIALVLVANREVLSAYWEVDASFGDSARAVMMAALVGNFVLYAAVFASSLAMSRYAAQMGGGLVARAWSGVALYGFLQPVHTLVISMLLPIYGPIAAVAFDNFIVLAAFSALAFGPIYQVEAAEVSRS
jgi:hypothetical protein